MKKITFFNEHLINKCFVSKTKLFYLLFITSFISFAQIPTTNLVAQYDFDNGALTDAINNVSLTKTGTASTNITDRKGIANGAMSLNGDNLSRPDIEFDINNDTNPYLPKTISFWLKTTTNDANQRVIYHDNDQSSLTDSDYFGVKIYLENGQVNAVNRAGSNGNVFTHPANIADNQWHHVVVQAYSTYTTPINAYAATRFITYIYVDNVKIGSSGYNRNGANVAILNKHVGDIVFSRLRDTSIASNDKYEDGIDEVLIYTRLLTNTEVSILGGFTGALYVDANATGNNTGTSWANAYTNLQTAFNNLNNGDEIWIASGTYKPSTSSRNTYYVIDKADIRIYGGFAGTESLLSDRIVGANETILSGDVLSNDANVTDFVANYSNTTRNADNTYRVINITATGNNLLLDGLTISDAHNNANATSLGAAVYKEKTVSALTIRNCIIRDNVSRNSNAGIVAEFELNNLSGTRGKLIIENCQFINNMSRWATGVYSYVRDNTNVDITIVNSLFDGNLSGDLNNTTASGLSGSAGWFRMLGNGSHATLNFSNNTVVNNIDNGTDQGLNATTHAVLAISKSTGFNGVLTAEISNNIFWDNKTTGNVATRSITDLYKLPVSAVNVYNSIDEANFNDSSITSTTSITNADPVFTDVANGDYTLTVGSPAINAGDNTKVPAGITTDLLGDFRISDTTVDMGAYEYTASLGINDMVLNENEIKLYPNPTASVLNIDMIQDLKQASVYSILGKEVIKAQNKQIDVSRLSNGVYLIKIEDENGNVSTKRFIKE